MRARIVPRGLGQRARNPKERVLSRSDENFFFFFFFFKDSRTSHPLPSTDGQRDARARG